MAEIGKLFITIGSKLEADGFDKVISKIKGVVTAGAALGAIGLTLDKSFKAYAEYETAVNRLSVAMQNQGVYTKQAIESHMKFAEEMRKLTTSTDEEVLAVMKTLTSFGLQDEQLRKTTKSVMDLSVAQGIDLTSAAMLVGKAFQGQTESLSRYGIKVSDTIPKTEKFDAVMAQINTRFGGAAAAELNTFAGKMTNMKNQFDELYKNLGKELIPTFDFWITKLQSVNNWLSQISETTDDVVRVQGQEQMSVKVLISLENELIKARGEGNKARIAQLEKAKKYLLETAKFEIKQGDNVTAKTKQDLDARNAAEEEAKNTKINREAVETQIKKDMMTATKIHEEETFLKRAETTQGFLEQATNTFSSYYDFLNTQTENKLNKDIDAENKSYETRKAWIVANVTDETERNKLLGELEQGHAATIQNLQQAAEQEEKRRRQAMKPVMIAEAIANTAVGATKALAQGGFFGIVLAALVMAQGAMQVAKIQAQKFATGGMAMKETLAIFGERGAEIALPLNHPNTIQALSSSMQQAMAVGGGVGGNIYVTVPPITTRQEAKRMGEIIGNEIYNKVKRNRKV